MQDGEHDQGGDNPEALGSPGTKRIRAPAPCACREGKKRCQDKTGPEEPAAGVGDGSGSDAKDSDGAQVGVGHRGRGEGRSSKLQLLQRAMHGYGVSESTDLLHLPHLP